MSNFERYSVTRAREEASQLKEKIENREARNYPEAERAVEAEKRQEAKTETKELAPDEVRLEKQKWADLAHSVRGTLSALIERESQQMALIDSRGIGGLAAGINALESFASKEAVKVDDIHNCLQGIAAGLRSIEDVRRPGMRENEDSLTKTSARIRRVRDELDRTRHAFSGSEEAKGAISRDMHSLIEAAERSGSVLARKRHALRQYLGR